MENMKTYFVVTGVVMHNNKFLLLKKAPNDYNYPNYWSFCSGFIKEFEAGEDTVLREIMEETGLDATIAKKGSLVTAKDAVKGKEWIVIPFLCMVNSDKVTLDHENVDYRWITMADLEKFQTVPNLVGSLKAVGIL